MKLRLSCRLARQLRATNRPTLTLAAALVLGSSPVALAGSAPAWMHSLVNAPVPEHTEKTEAVLLYSETNVTVVSTDKIKTQVREAYRILRPEGRSRGTVWVYLNSHRKIKSLHGWCIPAQGADYEVKDKDATEMSPPMIAGIELVQDIKARVLHVPAPDPGNIVGYEYEVEEDPFFLQDTWAFQSWDPVRESHYSLQLPSNWEFKSSWLNHPEAKPTQSGNNQWQWTVSDIKELRREPDMPPFSGVSGQMIVSFFPPNGPALNGFADWDTMGKWYWRLTSDRLEASSQIKQQVVSLTAAQTKPLQKMQTLAAFVQRDVRYVAIELGIGGWQPHPAAEVFSNRYGDCKDKATLLRSMLHEAGIESYHVVIYTQRGAITPQTPAHHGFNHVITAIRIPDDVSDPSLIATLQHPKFGKLLFFDPTDPITPFGQIRGALQSNYGLLVTANAGELIELPQQPSAMNSIQRVAKLSLDPSGNLRGDVTETRLGDRATSERYRLESITDNGDRIKPIESLLSNSLSTFHITHAAYQNLKQTDLPFGWVYSFESQNYAKNAGDLLLVRPRVLGNKGLSILETKEPRIFPIEFQGPARDTDIFDIAIPAGYVVDDLPPAVDADYGFASYHSKTEVKDKVIHYSRTFEVKELSVPVARADELKKFYRIIAGDERNTVVLKAGSQ
jgi:Domain of Unknown Function with PDB structure (DUF3857)/Transglutaminase-like superfamily